MSEYRRNKSSLALILLGVGVVVILAFFNNRHTRGDAYRTFWSPDRRFKVVVNRFPRMLAFPGQSGDAPGCVQLCDASGKILKEKKIEMVQIADDVSWSKTTVEVRLFVEWQLPE